MTGDRLVRLFSEGRYTSGTLRWGWQCLRCWDEERGYNTASTASEHGDDHVCGDKP